MYVDVGDCRLWFDVQSPEFATADGTSRPRRAIVGVHGGPGIDSTGLHGVLAPLADDAHLIRYDQRGHGRSDHGSPEQWTLEQWADDLAALVSALGLAAPVLLGTSFGARVALACAARHPGLVGGVVAAYGGARLDDDATAAAFERLGGPAAGAAARGRPREPEQSMREWLRVCWPLVTRSDVGRQHLTRMQEISIHSPDVHAAHTAKGLEQHPVEGLGQVRCPVLVLGGTDDPLSNPAVMTELAESLARTTTCTLVLAPGAGHTVFLDQPAPAYGAVRAFLADLPTPVAPAIRPGPIAPRVR